MNRRTHGRRSRRSGVLPTNGRSAFAHLMPSSTLGSHSTISPGAAASQGGFMSGIPHGGGGGGAGTAIPGTPVGGPLPGDPVRPGLPAPPIEPNPPEPAMTPNGPLWPGLPGLPTLPQAPALANLGTYPTQIPGQPIPVFSDPTQQVVPYQGVTWPKYKPSSGWWRAE